MFCGGEVVDFARGSLILLRIVQYHTDRPRRDKAPKWRLQGQGEAKTTSGSSDTFKLPAGTANDNTSWAL